MSRTVRITDSDIAYAYWCVSLRLASSRAQRALCLGLALGLLSSFVNAIVRDTLPRWGCYLHTRHSGRIRRRGDGGGRARTAQQCTTARHTHTQRSPPSRPTRRGRCSPAQQCTTRQAHTHTRACETALALLSSTIYDMLTSHLSRPCHTPRSSARASQPLGLHTCQSRQTLRNHHIGRTTGAQLAPSKASLPVNSVAELRHYGVVSAS